MRLMSQIFQPMITIPKNARIKNTEITCRSQKLLVECGLIRPAGAGLFTLLPLARRALDKLERAVRARLEAAGAQPVSLPALTSAALWERSGRLRDAEQELMLVEDRNHKKYLLAPTHEEAVAELLADVGPLSYKQLPLLFYQISNKYRDEQRPKRGLLRAREFSMMDAYGAHASAECARGLYRRLAQAYTHLFELLQLPAHRVEAPSGEMGGSLSHEWHVCARAGEDALRVCASCSHAALAGAGAPACERCGAPTDTYNSIEVGHTFVLGARYSTPLNALFVPATSTPEPLLMSCYGIGITRLLAASVEVLSSEGALRWPRVIAPFSALLIGPKEGSREWAALGWEGVSRAHERVSRAALRGDVLVDDRHSLTVGKRLLLADKMGYPAVVVCGRAVRDSPPRFEVHFPGGTSSSPLLLTMEELETVSRTLETPPEGDTRRAEQT